MQENINSTIKMLCKDNGELRKALREVKNKLKAAYREKCLHPYQKEPRGIFTIKGKKYQWVQNTAREASDCSQCDALIDCSHLCGGCVEGGYLKEVSQNKETVTIKGTKYLWVHNLSGSERSASLLRESDCSLCDIPSKKACQNPGCEKCRPYHYLKEVRQVTIKGKKYQWVQNTTSDTSDCSHCDMCTTKDWGERSFYSCQDECLPHHYLKKQEDTAASKVTTYHWVHNTTRNELDCTLCDKTEETCQYKGSCGAHRYLKRDTEEKESK